MNIYLPIRHSTLWSAINKDNNTGVRSSKETRASFIVSQMSQIPCGRCRIYLLQQFEIRSRFVLYFYRNWVNEVPEENKKSLSRCLLYDNSAGTRSFPSVKPTALSFPRLRPGEAFKAQNLFPQRRSFFCERARLANGDERALFARPKTVHSLQ